MTDRDEIIERAARAKPEGGTWVSPAQVEAVLNAVGYFELVEERDRQKDVLNRLADAYYSAWPYSMNNDQLGLLLVEALPERRNKAFVPHPCSWHNRPMTGWGARNATEETP